MRFSKSSSDTLSRETPAALAEESRPAVRHILLLSPHRDIAAGLSRSLEAFGANVEMVDAPSDFWERLHAFPWDVVFLESSEEWPLSADFLRRVRGAQPEAGLWLIMGEDDAPRAGGEGVQVFRKPVPPDELFKALAARPPRGETRAPEARILTVHPEPLFCEGLLEFLAMEGHRARSVRNGAEALAEIRRLPYDMALVNADLPDIGVWDLAARLREARPDLAVIVLADYASLDGVLAAMRAHVFDYLLKPLDAFAFRRTLQKAMENQAMARQIRSLLDGLKRANQDLFRLNELKSKFLRTVTHDLRSPLTALKGFAQALRDGLIPSDRYELCFRTMVKESEQMEHLIADLMDFAAIESGRLRLAKAVIDPAPVFRGVVERFRPVAEKKKIDLSAEGLEGELPAVEADARRLDQALTNLVGNALKHTPAGGAIAVRVSRRKGSLEVRVQDTGEGISRADLSRVFEEFFQVEGASNVREGLGLGLVIVREIVHRHGGEIGAESDGPGKGATFWFTLPSLRPGEGGTWRTS